VNSRPELHGPNYRLPAPPPPDPTGWLELRRKARATLWPPQPVAWAALLAVAIVASGTFGLWFMARLPGRLPTATDWKAVAVLLTRDLRPGDAVALAPAWAERAREVLPDRVPSRPEVRIPVLALPSWTEADAPLPGVRRVWLLSLPAAPGGPGPAGEQLRARSAAVEGPVRIGRIEVTRIDLRDPLLPSWTLAGGLAAARVETRGPAPTRETREVGFLPRDCVVLRFPGPKAEAVSLRIPAVPVGRILWAHAGMVGDPPRGAPPVSLRVKLDGVEVGRGEAAGPFLASVVIDTARLSSPGRELTLEAVPTGPLPRGICVDVWSVP
jgi:hypothetical protein